MILGFPSPFVIFLNSQLLWMFGEVVRLIIPQVEGALLLSLDLSSTCSYMMKRQLFFLCSLTCSILYRAGMSLNFGVQRTT